MLNMKNLEGIRIVNDNTVYISLLSGTISGSYLIQSNLLINYLLGIWKDFTI